MTAEGRSASLNASFHACPGEESSIKPSTGSNSQRCSVHRRKRADWSGRCSSASLRGQVTIFLHRVNPPAPCSNRTWRLGHLDLPLRWSTWSPPPQPLSNAATPAVWSNSFSRTLSSWIRDKLEKTQIMIFSNQHRIAPAAKQATHLNAMRSILRLTRSGVETDRFLITDSPNIFSRTTKELEETKINLTENILFSEIWELIQEKGVLDSDKKIRSNWFIRKKITHRKQKNKLFSRAKH